MKVVIFAGGSGRRLWPISRKRTPKQFEPIVGERSTIELAVERVGALCPPTDIFVSTNESYLDIVTRQLPELPAQNIIGEPTRRDLAAAVGLATVHLAHHFDPQEVITILWGDNLMSDVPAFQQLLRAAESLITQQQADILFIGETPRFPNQNLGWIGLGPEKGKANGLPYYQFQSLTYRPDLELCRQFFANGHHVWNTGYFVTTLAFVLQAYQTHQPQMWEQLQEIAHTIATPNYQPTLRRVYPTLPEMSFDDAILTHLASEQALVLHCEMGWSDPGTLYALKEALQTDLSANVTKGSVQAPQTVDSLLYNYESHKLLVAIGLEGMIVINTPDAILVVHKDHIPDVKKVVDGLEGTEWERFS